MPRAATSEDRLLASIGRLRAYVEREGYRGYDPYDALNSPWFSRGLFDWRPVRIAATQTLRRLPVNLRPALRITKGLNPKALGLFLSGYASLHARRPDPVLRERMGVLVGLLEGLRAGQGEGRGWGYNFPWQNRFTLYPRHTPTIVNTSFIGHALLDAVRQGTPGPAPALAAGAADFIMGLPKSVDAPGRMCLSYTPLDRARVYNGNALAASFLARQASLSRDGRMAALARRLMAFVVAGQRPDGAWVYGEDAAQGWIDLHHTAFVLESLGRYLELQPEPSWEKALESGLDYFHRAFLDLPGPPRTFHDRPFPADVHAAAAVPALIRLHAVRDPEPSLSRILDWLIGTMQDARGYFYYQRHRAYTVKIPYMRWSQAWAFHALCSAAAWTGSRGGRR